MAGSLIKIDEEIVTSAVASVTLTGIDSTYDVYQLLIKNVIPETDNLGDLKLRVTESGTPNSTANYDWAYKVLWNNGAFFNQQNTNQGELDLSGVLGTGTGESQMANIYIFNAPNSSEYTFFTVEQMNYDKTPDFTGFNGGGVFTSASTVNGVNIFIANSCNIASGKFSLYGLKK